MTRERAALRPNAATVEDSLAALEATYISSNPKSAAHYAAAKESLPGGNTRTILHFDPFPLVLAEGAGSRVTDLDGHSYTDFLGEYSAGLYGHSHPVITLAIKEALAKGIVLGGANTYEARLANLLTARFPSLEQVRFCNSGTEANLMALCLARAATGKNAILFFTGAYHGGGMSYPVQGARLNIPFTAIQSRYNDVDAAVDTIREQAINLAAVIVEPMMGAAGCIPGTSEFLSALRKSTAENGVLLIFDEVMTSRCSSGGLQKVLGIIPDLTTLGKYLGGGLSFGAFGGRRDLMKRFDPSVAGALPHSGTFNNNVLSMAAGEAGLSRVLDEAAITALNDKGSRLRAALEAIAKKHGVPFLMTGTGSLQCMHFQDRAVLCAEDAVSPAGLRKLVHLAMLERGFYMTRRGYTALSLAMEEKDIDGFVNAFEDVLGAHGALMG